MRVGPSLLALFWLALGVGCASRSAHAPPDAWYAWQVRRQESVAGAKGWMTLAGLHWLPEGRSSIGSDDGADVRLPTRGEGRRLGDLVRSGRTVKFRQAGGADVRWGDRRLTEKEIVMVSDMEDNPTRLEVDSVQFGVIERGNRMAVRVRDFRQAPGESYRGLRRYPYDWNWRLEGRFEPYSGERTLTVPDVTGGVQDVDVVGEIVLAREGVEHRLVAVRERGEEDLFIVFRDQTAGKSTYAAGRYMYVAPPGPDGKVVVDFNLAYSPPCAFTPYATCVYPPEGNRLPFPIRAGEKKPGTKPGSD